MTEILWAIIACGLLACVYAAVTIRNVMAADAGNARMQEIASAVREGAQAYLDRQYRTIAIVGVANFALAWLLLGPLVAIGFLIAGPAGDTVVPYTTEMGITLLWIAAVLTFYTGYDYWEIGSTQLDGLIAGVRLTF